jgi:hypothetical protein
LLIIYSNSSLKLIFKFIYETKTTIVNYKLNPTSV